MSEIFFIYINSTGFCSSQVELIKRRNKKKIREEFFLKKKLNKISSFVHMIRLTHLNRVHKATFEYICCSCLKTKTFALLTN